MNKSRVSPSNLDRQKVEPALAVFSRKVTSALRLEFGEKANETCLFLDCSIIIFELLLAINAKKQSVNPLAKPFTLLMKLDPIFLIKLWIGYKMISLVFCAQKKNRCCKMS